MSLDHRTASNELIAGPSPSQSELASPDKTTYLPVASAWHTVVLVMAQAVLVYRAATHAHSFGPNRIQIYERTMLVQWLGFAFVVFGVWLRKSPLSSVLGERWRSPLQLFRDLGIGVAFSIVSTMVFSVVASHAGGHAADSAAHFLLPQSGPEMAVWVALSITAGICEEALYRGYLQRQFMALTQSVPAGILLSAAAFGAAHAYQGLHQAVVIALDGATLGMLAHWRRSVRPGMISHAFKDVMAPILMATVKQ